MSAVTPPWHLGHFHQLSPFAPGKISLLWIPYTFLFHSRLVVARRKREGSHFIDCFQFQYLSYMQYNNDRLFQIGVLIIMSLRDIWGSFTNSARLRRAKSVCFGFFIHSLSLETSCCPAQTGRVTFYRLFSIPIPIICNIIMIDYFKRFFW